MTIEMIELVGLGAGAITVAGYLPQAVKAVRTRRTKDLSLTAFLLLSLSAAGWVTYGVLSGSIAVIITNSLVLICAGMTAVVKIIELTHK